MLPAGYYVALIAMVAVLAWVVFKSGNPDAPIKPPERTRRDELIEARDRVRRQIEILETPARRSDYISLSRQNVERLQAVLKEIEDELKEQPTRDNGQSAG
jgi:hypothetical protein